MTSPASPDNQIVPVAPKTQINLVLAGKVIAPILALISAIGIIYYRKATTSAMFIASVTVCAVSVLVAFYFFVIQSIIAYCKKQKVKDLPAPIDLPPMAPVDIAPSPPRIRDKVTKTTFEGCQLTNHSILIPKETVTDPLIQECEAWVPAHAKGNKRVLLKHLIHRAKGLLALLQAMKGKDTTLSYSIIEDHQNSFAQRYTTPFKPGEDVPAYGRDSGFFTYQEPKLAYLDCAAPHMGGGWRSSGSVQEETMFFSFPRLQLLDFITQRLNTPIFCKKGHEPTPFILHAGKRSFECKTTLYGSKNLHANKAKDIPDQVTDAQNQKKALIIGAAAFSFRRHKNKPYDRAMLKDHLKAFELVCIGARASGCLGVATPAWGCGAFGNKEKTMVAIMMMASKTTKMPLAFYDCPDGNKTNGHNGNYNENMLAEMRVFVNQFNTPEEMIEYILAHQFTEGFAPKFFKGSTNTKGKN